MLALGMVGAGLCSADPFHDAASSGDLARVKVILKAHPKLVDAKDAIGVTALDYALSKGHLDVAKFLLAHGASVKSKDVKAGETPLYYAVMSGRTDAVQLLLSHNADINARNTFGGTPLTFAEKSHHPNIAEFLSAHGGHR